MEVNHENRATDQPVERAKRRSFIRLAGVVIVLAGLLAAGALVGYRLAATRLTADSAEPANLSSRSTNGVKVTLAQCLALLKQTGTNNVALRERVQELVDEAARKGLELDQAEPSLMVISYRQHDAQVDNVVVQVYQTPAAGTISILNPDGVVRARLGDELFGSAESLMQLLYHPVSYLGAPADVTRQRRAMEAAIEGDLTLLREQTVDPLRVVVVMPRAEKFLPGSIRTRVQSVVLSSELTFGEWHTQLAMITDNEQTAQQVGNTIAAWREIASTLANTYAKHSAGLPLRESLESSEVRVAENQVIALASVPSKTVVRVTKEVAGHGGAAGCSQGFYKKPEHWPSGVTQLQLGCQVYTKAECIALLTTAVGGDASLSLAHQLIASKINRLVGLPATPQQVQAITDADALLCSFTGRLPCHVPSSSPTGQQMTSLAGILDVYNNSCHTGSTGGSGGDTGGGGVGGGGSGGGSGGNGGSGGGTNTITKGNNGVGNGPDPQPPGNPPINDGAGTAPGAPGNNKKK